MQTKKSHSLSRSVSVLAALLAGGWVHAAGKSPEPELSTPAGITIVNVSKIYVSSQDQFLWRRLGDAEGKPLYTFEADPVNGSPACVGECAREFIPLPAGKGAKGFGDWSVVMRDEGGSQWAYQGKPLYRYSGKDPDGEPFAGDTASAVSEDPNWYNPSSEFYVPKQGWSRAAYTPEKTLQRPPSIGLSSLPIANGFGLVDAATGMTIYAVDPGKKMSTMWLPVKAAGLAMPIGDFAITTAEDGSRQWSYKGQRLFTYRGDYTPGDVEGVFVENGAQAALVYRNFMPESLAINLVPGRGPMVLTREGRSVYTQARYSLQYGGRQTRTGYSVPYNEAKKVGTRGCVDKCLSEWQPLLAPANAQSSGYWEVAARPDGKKQWLYKGSAVYTFAMDKKPGDVLGNNRHDMLYGDPSGKVDLSLTERQGGGASYQAGSGFYWRTAALFY